VLNLAREDSKLAYLCGGSFWYVFHGNEVFEPTWLTPCRHGFLAFLDARA
jgi:hypothetical protein